jgi:hypothetical protein
MATVDPTKNVIEWARLNKEWLEKIKAPLLHRNILRPLLNRTLISMSAPTPDALLAAVSAVAVDAQRETIDWRGLPLYTSDKITDELEDWSACRSPSRARRRRAMGHPQRVRIIAVPSSRVISVKGPHRFYIMHPETLDRLLRSMQSYYAVDAKVILGSQV